VEKTTPLPLTGLAIFFGEEYWTRHENHERKCANGAIWFLIEKSIQTIQCTFPRFIFKTDPFYLFPYTIFPRDALQRVAKALSKAKLDEFPNQKNLDSPLDKALWALWVVQDHFQHNAHDMSSVFSA